MKERTPRSCVPGRDDAAAVRTYMKQMRLNVEDFSRQCQVSPSTVTKFLTEKRIDKNSYTKILAAALPQPESDVSDRACASLQLLTGLVANPAVFTVTPEQAIRDPKSLDEIIRLSHLLAERHAKLSENPDAQPRPHCTTLRRGKVQPLRPGESQQSVS